MNKIIVTESQLKKMIYESVKENINEGQENEVLGALLYAYKQQHGGQDARYLLGNTAAKIHNMVSKDKKTASDYVWGANGKSIKSGDKGTEKNGGNKESYGKPEIDFNTGKPVKYTTSNNNITFIDDSDKDVLIGHYVGVSDTVDNSTKNPLKAAYESFKTRSSANLGNQVKKSLNGWLTKRDAYFSDKNVLKEAIDEWPGRQLLRRGAQWVGKKILGGKGIGSALGSIAGGAGEISGNGLSGSMNAQKVEKELLPLILSSLCSSLSIEPEDPMYAMITSKDTRKKIMKNVERNL